MLTFVVRRLLLAIPTVIAVTALLFLSVTTLLGSPASMMLGENATPEAIAYVPGLIMPRKSQSR